VNKKLLVGVVIGLLVLVGFWLYYRSRDDGQVIYDGGGAGGGDVTKEQKVTDQLSLVPAYPGSVMGDSYVEDGLTHDEYEAPVGVTAGEVLDYYEQELAVAGWRMTLRDVGDSKLEMLSEDGNQLRVAIFFTGYEDQGVVYFVDNRAPGGEPWPPMMMQ